MNDQVGLGPQVDGERRWKARMRLHQSWWRSERLRVPYGHGSGRARHGLYGNMLTADDGRRGMNFVSDGAWAAYKAHSGRGVEPDRCERNLLSSQPMAFNLFGPLTLDITLATRLLRPLAADLDQVVAVRIEEQPHPRGEYLNDRTAFDALVVYEAVDGSRRLLGIETKLTEDFSPDDYGITPTYRDITESDGSPWRPGTTDQCNSRPWRQLWRDHMLVEASARHPSHPYGRHGRVVVVRHPLDPDIGPVVAGYKQLLGDPGTCVDLPLDRLLAAWRDLDSGHAEQQWLQRLQDRYVNLALSDHLTASTPGRTDRALNRDTRRAGDSERLGRA